MDDVTGLADPDAFEDRARARLPADIYRYFAGGAGDGRTVAANRVAFERVRLRPRVLTGAGEPDLAITTLGQRLAMPVAVAPVALQRLAHPEGELATARAAATAGTAMILSTMATTSIEEVVCVAAPLWFQLYLLRDRGRRARSSTARLRRALRRSSSPPMPRRTAGGAGAR